MLSAVDETRERERARAELLASAARPADQVDLCEAALWIAAEARPSLSVPQYLARVDELAAQASASLGACDAATGAARLVRFLSVDQGFTGNAEDYYDARNSYLDQVLERRTGIPITLSILWVGIARRLGLDAAGVAFPGHFLARVERPDGNPVVVDAFSGRLLGERECEALWERAAGHSARFDATMIRPAPPREVLARVLRNLKQIHAQAGELEEALRCSDGILALLPDEPLELRDRGLLLRALGCFGPALRDLEHFAAQLPPGEDAEALRPILADLRQRARTLH